MCARSNARYRSTPRADVAPERVERSDARRAGRGGRVEANNGRRVGDGAKSI